MYQKGIRELEIINLYREDYNKRLYLRQIAKLTKIPLKSIQNSLANLEKEKILKSKIEGKNKYFFLNLENIKTKSLILHSEIYKTDIFLEKYPEFKTFLKSINTNVPMIVFGSFAKFSPDKNSDVDILIISNKQQELPSHLLPHKIHQLNLSESSLEKEKTFLKELKENHIIINNHSFYVNFLWSKNEK